MGSEMLIYISLLARSHARTLTQAGVAQSDGAAAHRCTQLAIGCGATRASRYPGFQAARDHWEGGSSSGRRYCADWGGLIEPTGEPDAREGTSVE